MNRLQKLILWIGVLAIVGMCLFPPWFERAKLKGLEKDKAMGYHSLFSLPRKPADSFYNPHINITVLIIQYFVVALLTGAGIATTAKSRKGNSDAG